MIIKAWIQLYCTLTCWYYTKITTLHIKKKDQQSTGLEQTVQRFCVIDTWLQYNLTVAVLMGVTGFLL